MLDLITKVKCIIIAITSVYCTFVVLPISIITPDWIQMTLGVTTQRGAVSVNVHVNLSVFAICRCACMNRIFHEYSFYTNFYEPS